jgi:hypothetical protein
VTIRDGFYACGNRCYEALLHDDVAIVAGRVSITPEIKELSSNLTQSPYTKSISLHWVCRESGLSSYISENSMALFQMKAHAACIYHGQIVKRLLMKLVNSM